MKTAEVAIEYILAGLLALCAFALPFAKLLKIDVSLGTDGALDTGAIVGVLGVAYLLGIVFDRAADTLLGPFEVELRIERAAELFGKAKGSGDDPFPVADLLYKLRKEVNGNFEWLQSLRSRIRTTREFAVLGLPAILGIAVHINCTQKCSWPLTWNVSHTAVALNLFLIAASVVVLQTGRQKPPRTTEFMDRKPCNIKVLRLTSYRNVR